MEQFFELTGRHIKVYLRDKGAVFFSFLSAGIVICLMNPQPTKEEYDMKTIWIEVYRDIIEDHNEDNNLSEILVTKDFARQYFDECIAKDDDQIVFGKWAMNHVADETMDFYQYAKEHNAIIEIRHC